MLLMYRRYCYDCDSQCIFPNHLDKNGIGITARPQRDSHSQSDAVSMVNPKDDESYVFLSRVSLSSDESCIRLCIEGIHRVGTGSRVDFNLIQFPKYQKCV